MPPGLKKSVNDPADFSCLPCKMQEQGHGRGLFWQSC